MCIDISIANYDELRITCADGSFIQKRLTTTGDDNYNDDECIYIIYLLHVTHGLNMYFGDLIRSIYQSLFMSKQVPGIVRCALLEICNKWWYGACASKLNMYPPPNINMMLCEYGQRAEFDDGKWNRDGKVSFIPPRSTKVTYLSEM